MAPTPALAEVCSTLVCSISSIMHGGALRRCPGRARQQLLSRLKLTVSLLCSQPVTVTLKAPSAVSVTQWGVSVFAKPTSLGSAATSAPQEVTASESVAVLVSEKQTHKRLA